MLAVLVASQAVALLLLAAATGIRGDGPPAAGGLALAALAGAGGVLGLAAFYRGLAVGRDGRGGTHRRAGRGAAGGRGRGHGRPPGRPGGGGDRAGAGRRGAVVAGGGRGRQPAWPPAWDWRCWRRWASASSSPAMDAAGDDDVLWALLVARCTSVALLGVAVAIARPALGELRGHERAVRRHRRARHGRQRTLRAGRHRGAGERGGGAVLALPGGHDPAGARGARRAGAGVAAARGGAGARRAWWASRWAERARGQPSRAASSASVSRRSSSAASGLACSSSSRR